MGSMPVLVDELAQHGPWLLFALAILETCFVTGLVVPSGLATSAATIMVLEGTLPAFGPVLLAAAGGGFVGDTLGFWIGRVWGRRLLRPGARWSGVFGGRHGEMDQLLGRHPLYSVTVARLVSFVRTLMPMAAGMSGIPYARYVPFELLGLLGWLVIYVSIGFAGLEGWELATQVLGVGGAVAFALGTVGAVWILRRRRRVERARAAASEVEPC